MGPHKQQELHPSLLAIQDVNLRSYTGRFRSPLGPRTGRTNAALRIPTQPRMAATEDELKEMDAVLQSIAIRLEKVSDMIFVGTKQLANFVESQEKINQDIAPFRRAFQLNNNRTN